MIGANFSRPARQARRGFTLMELIVALGIFTTVVASVSNIFILTSRSQRKVYSMERGQADARFVMEAIAREVRTGRFDFAALAGQTLPLSFLPLVDATGQPLVFERSEAATEQYCADAESRPCLLVRLGSGDPESITPKGVRILNARFYVNPLVNPWEFHSDIGGFVSDLQPRVTVVLATESIPPGKTIAAAGADRAIMQVQTTITSRGYSR